MKKFLASIVIFVSIPLCVTSCNKNKEKNPFITYDTIEVNYELPKIDNYNPDLLTITSSDESLFNVVKAVKDENKVVVESNLNNKRGKANLLFTYNNNLLNYKIPLNVRAPKNMQEACDAVILAAIKLPSYTEYEVTFDFTNGTSLNSFDECLEIYSRRRIIGYRYKTGTNVTNCFAIDTDEPFASLSSTMEPGDGEYCNNLTSLNYKSRAASKLNDREFYIDQVNRELEVKNSEELFWAVEHGYNPKISSNAKSTVNDVYKEARNFCLTINDNWSDLVKFREIYDKLNEITYYDFSVLDDKTHPWWEHQAYFLEGVFIDDGKAVCDGFSKAYALLCGILGLPCFRSYGFVEDDDSGHAWNYVQLDKKWYLVCPTWMKIQQFKGGEEPDPIATWFKDDVSLPNYSAFLASKNYFKNLGAPFSDLAFPNITRSNTRYSKSVDEVDYHITSTTNANSIKGRIKKYIADESCVYVTFNDNESESNIHNWTAIIASAAEPGKYEANCCGFYIENTIAMFICFKDV